MHGDILCTDDVDYQQFRAMVRDPQWQDNFLARYPADRLLVAKRIRELKAWRDAKAQTLAIDPSLVLTKTLICDIAKLNPGSIRQIKTVEGLRNWRIREFGRELIDLLKKIG